MSLLDKIAEVNPKALVPDGLEKAVICFILIHILMKDMDEDEANEYFDFNVIGAWMGEGTPCFATLKGDVC